LGGGGGGGRSYAVACWTCAGVFFASAGLGAALIGVFGAPGLDLVFVPLDAAEI